MNYHEVMETYNHPPSIKYIPRIFSWLLVFVLLFGVSKTAYAYEAEPVIWVQVLNGQMIGLYVRLTYQTQLAIGMLQMPTTHSVMDSTGKMHLGSMQMV